MKKKRLSAAILAMAMLLYGCGANANKGEGSLTKTDSLAGGASRGGDMDAYGVAGEMSGGAYESKRGDMGASPMGSSPMEEAPMESAMADSLAPVASPASFDAAIKDGESVISESEDGWFDEDEMVEPVVEQVEQVEPMPGLLTAGEWCDNQNWGFMANLVNTGRFDFRVYGMKPYERVVLHVLSDGEAAPNVKAELMDAEGNKIAESVTDYAGTAYLYYNVYADDAGEPAYVIISANNTSVRAELLQDEGQMDIGLKCPVTGTENPWDGEGQDEEQMDAVLKCPVTGAEDPRDDEGQDKAEGQEMSEVQETPEGNGTADGQGIPQNGQNQQALAHLKSYELTVEITNYVRPAKRLDVMFVFDTTGSMGDELLYLQKEFEDIAARVADQSTRFSVNFYRDFEDEYVVRPNEFTSDIDKVASLLNAEYADGGGDYEEAVDLALVNAVLEHDWNADSVKLLFLILDAPPHNTAEVAANLKEAVSAASSMGIRIIPIASSGVDTATEALLRNIAMLTGGTYTFLTNDSGIGGDHLEPTIGSYTVEALNDLIVRLIRQYYQ